MSDDPNLNTNMLFDLRQTYAIKILEPILLAIESHRENNEFTGVYEKMTRSLYANIHQKLKEGDKNEWLELKEKVLRIINKYPDAFVGRDNNPQSIELIKDALQEMEMWLKFKMEENGLFGKGYEYDWDEI